MIDEWDKEQKEAIRKNDEIKKLFREFEKKLTLESKYSIALKLCFNIGIKKINKKISDGRYTNLWFEWYLGQQDWETILKTEHIAYMMSFIDVTNNLFFGHENKYENIEDIKRRFRNRNNNSNVL